MQYLFDDDIINDSLQQMLQDNQKYSDSPDAKTQAEVQIAQNIKQIQIKKINSTDSQNRDEYAQFKPNQANEQTQKISYKARLEIFSSSQKIQIQKVETNLNQQSQFRQKRPNKSQQKSQEQVQIIQVQKQKYLCCLIQQRKVLKFMFDFTQPKSQQSSSCVQQVLKKQIKSQEKQINKQHIICRQNKQCDVSDTSLSTPDNEDIQQLFECIKQSNLHKFMQLEGDKFELFQQYRINVQKVLSTKMAAEIRCGDYTDISFSLYKRVLTIWENLTNQTKNQLVGVDKFLKFGHLERLSPRMWINDVIISAYIQLINSGLNQSKKYCKSKPVILDSLKADNIFNRKDVKQMQRLLYKNGITKHQKCIIIIINVQKHWFFLTLSSNMQMQNKQAEQKIIIYDSLPKKSLQFYCKLKIIQKIISFFKMWNQQKIKMQICQNFPIQRNNSDCGVMVLCGIKDVARNYLTWSFDQNDMIYKRVLITKQLVDCQITGF